jgi:hypothetical protein
LCAKCHSERHDIRESYIAFLRREDGTREPGTS